MLVILFLCLAFHKTLSGNYSTINLPQEHLQYYFANFPKLAKECETDPECPYKNELQRDKCWGYEPECKWDKQYSVPSCPGDHKGWVKNKFEQQHSFYTQADFGFVKQQRAEIKMYCDPLFQTDSSLECSEHMRFCRGRNLMINFTALTSREEPIRYKMDVLKEGEIGGYCDFHEEELLKQADHLSPLQSWGPELRFFKRLTQRPIVEGDCDVVIEKPTFIMKIDATVNMYHHFCDFFNLYASQHVNSTNVDAFSTDVHILIWESYTYRSAFEETFQAFTDHSVWDLKTFRGETVCFKNVVFPLLPRMIFGLYYNTPIIYGCEKSGLFHAFSRHILHRLKIPIHERKDREIRVTLLSRDTKYRRILNEDKLLAALKKRTDISVKKVVYDRNMNFKQQLEITRNTDVFIGMHGAGLTHLLFLPDWAAVFEIYNCEDKNCYLDLARLRGVKYFTWQKLEKLKQEDQGTNKEGGEAHAKFTNYSFDVDEFVRIVEKAVQHVKNHPKFKEMLSGIDESQVDFHDEL